ncbi:type VI secretion system protein TssR domain-containing protein [Porphyromonas crevioricanis]|nr:type VI secretion system protein TssR domain-containing protein [Porphyromonas crevioricanis]
MNDINKKTIGFGLIFLLLMGCTPVNRFTKIKRTPNEYTRNYCCGDIAVSRSVEKRSPWIVYSDRSNNPTYYNPGGKVQLKTASYLEPFLVIGRKGDFLRLIKYSPDILENGKLKNRKQAEYYGWIHQDNLILSSHATTNIATGRTIKMISMFKDVTPLASTKSYFSSDSVIIFKEPELLTPIAKVPFQTPLYLAKRSVDDTKSFIIGKERIIPDSAATMVSGWLSSSLLMPFGEILYMDYSMVPVSRYSVYNQFGAEHYIPNEDIRKLAHSNSSLPFTGMHAVSSILQGDSVSSVQTTLTVPMIDNSRNFVYSLSGKPITYTQIQGLKESLKQINIVFVFAGQKPVYDKFEMLVSSIQGLSAVLKQKRGYSYKVGAVIGFAGNDEQFPSEISLNSDIDSVLGKFEGYADSKGQMDPKLNEDAWNGLRKATQLLAPYRMENNVIVLIGENGNTQEQVDHSIIESLVQNNCRILGYQIYSDTGDSFNNFVLQVEDMIDRSAKQLSLNKKDILVHSEQLRLFNQFIERTENIYSLDFPKSSMQQGWIVFPRKKEQLPQDLLIATTDSLIREIEKDNDNVLAHLNKAFQETGQGRTRLNSYWLDLNGLSKEYSVPTKDFVPLAHMKPGTSYPLTLETSTADLSKGNYILLLSETELSRLRGFINDLTRLRVDYKYTGKSSLKKGKSKTCPTPPQEKSALGEKPTTPPIYLNTSAVRKGMIKAYCKWIQDEKIYPLSKRNILSLSLSQAQQQAFTMPSFHPVLKSLKVRELRKKKIFPDAELDELLDYFLKKRKELEEAITPDNRIEVNGEIYYKIEATKMP